MNVKIFFLTTFAATLSMAAIAGKPQKQVFIPMDYSTCGYHASEKKFLT